MINCNLTKPESTFDNLKKQYTELPPTDVALLATALVEAGRLAHGVHDEKIYEWNSKEFQGMIDSTAKEVEQVMGNFEQEKTKKAAKAAEEESITLVVNLTPNIKAGEEVLGQRNDLKVLFGDMVQEGIEYMYSPTDFGWHWTIERVNWSAQSVGDMRRRLKFRAEMHEPHLAIELGPGGKRKVSKK